jgi:hypothetical protein
MKHTTKFRISFILNIFLTLWSFLILINSIGISTPKTILSSLSFIFFGLLTSFVVIQNRKNKTNLEEL